MEQTITRLARVYGIVQGVGFRPTVSRHAMNYGVTGSVCNKGPYVEIIAQGQAEQVEVFLKAVKKQPPERAVILKMDVEKLPADEALQMETFDIIESEKIKGDIFVSPDIAICEKCKKEMYDPKDRRYLHPFINCTCCGPRLTILDSMPYDRVRTSMSVFPMCPECAQEYYSPDTRRYDAQPVCCNECGPEVYLLDSDPMIRGKEAIYQIRKAIVDGLVVAIKGIGGFHLCCDATNEEAVQLLRRRKKRPAKPFAVMMKDETVVERECVLEESQVEILTGHQKPIILLERKNVEQECEEERKVAPSVAPDNPKLGVMLPYAPIHMLLFDYPDGIDMPDCLVMTSANTSGAPICRDDEDARRELGALCDYILSHDRLIRLRADDTVMDYHHGQPYMIRRSRGYAPLPFARSNHWAGEVLAIGGELKNTFCLVKNQLYYPSPYLGDMGDVRTVKALEESVKRMEDLLETKPQIIACDLHPKYNTTTFAQAYAKEINVACIQVQHHYAHILSCMVENDVEGPVIGVSYDGTGYGTDGTIWGGEILLADYAGFERKASIMPFKQVGGDASSKEGWRIAVSMLVDLYGLEKAMDYAERFGLCPPNMVKLVGNMASRGINTVTSTSAGRLYDAVSAILGIRKESTFEGEASCQLQYVAQKGRHLDVSDLMDRLQVLLEEEKDGKDLDRAILPTHLMIKVITEAMEQGQSIERLAYWFHRVFAEYTVRCCKAIAKETKVQAVALSGGVYQNTLLLDETVNRLEEEGLLVYTHHLLPPNDGGICVGQAAAAMYELNHR